MAFNASPLQREEKCVGIHIHIHISLNIKYFHLENVRCKIIQNSRILFQFITFQTAVSRVKFLDNHFSSLKMLIYSTFSST